MKILLDTNIIIHREASSGNDPDIGLLFYWLDKLHHEKYIHPVTIEELRRHKDPRVRETFFKKIQQYQLLKTEAPLSNQLSEFSKLNDKTSNDVNDSRLINELINSRVDALITEDRAIHHKAELLSVEDSVFTIDSFLEKVLAENPELKEYTVLPIKKDLFGNVRLEDEFFDSFREDYKGFDRWFNGKANEPCYVHRSPDGSVRAFLYLKVETRGEDYSDIHPVFAPKKRLKIGTLKVTANGYKLGERCLKIIFDHALLFEVEEVYVTIFNKHPAQERLITLLKEWGFHNYGIKETPTGNEFVYVRAFSKKCSLDTPRHTFPYISRRARPFLASVYPEYHTELFPDSILKTESPLNFVGDESYRNAIGKSFISRSYERDLRSGDIIVFYRTGGYYEGVVTTLGIVEGVHNNLTSAEDLILRSRKRTVLSDKELRAMWNWNPKYRPFIVDFLYAYSFPKKINLKTLMEMGIVRDIQSAPRGFTSISWDQLNQIIKTSKSHESIIVD